jgi:hypothetical protein
VVMFFAMNDENALNGKHSTLVIMLNRSLCNTFLSFLAFKTTDSRFSGWRVHRKPQIEIVFMRPHHLRTFPDMHLVCFNDNN